MNKMYAAGAFLILGSFFFQDEASASDLVKFPTGPAAWTVVISPSPSASAPSSSGKHLTGITVIQDGTKRRSILTWSSGPTTEKWEIPSLNLILVEDSKGQAYSVLGGSMGAGNASIPFVASSFSWLTPQLLQEKDPIPYQEKQCFHYKGLSGDPRIAGSSFKSEAWIDSTTLLPVALDDGEELGVYTFSKDPPPPLILPAKFANVFERYQEGMGILKPVGTH